MSPLSIRPALAFMGVRPSRGRRALLALALLVASAAALGVVAVAGAGSRAAAPSPSPGSASPQPSGSTPSGATSPSGGRRPNIVFVLADDLSSDLVRYMPAVHALERRGLTFTNYFVSDSLCCPSRASIFTGKFPHNTGVFTNTGPDGGIGAFFAAGDELDTFNLALQRSGYRTAMMGKYLNGYLQGPADSPVSGTYVPPGWNEWDVAGWGYPEYDYELNVDGTLRWFGHAHRDYLTDVIARRAAAFIARTPTSRPFFLELATFAPHSPYTPAYRYRRSFSRVIAPRPPSFDALPTNAPSWLADHPPLTAAQVARIDRVFRQRVRAVQAIDDMIVRVEDALAARGELDDTYIVFSSDNGLHTGEYRLMPGKLTAFDTDIHVPLVVAGPGVPAGASTAAMTENVDLASTFSALGGTSLPGDGHSLVPLLRGGAADNWRNAVLVEHHGPDFGSADPDAQTALSGNPTTYEAMRTPDFLYVEYRDGEREYYDLRTDPFELDNVAASLPVDRLTELHDELAALERCRGSGSCWAAAHVAP